MTLPFNIVIIIAGFYLAFRTSLRGSFVTGIIVGVAMATLAALAQTGTARPVVLIFASRIVAGVMVYPAANHFQAPLALSVIVPLGFLLLLAGGPIDAVQMFTE